MQCEYWHLIIQKVIFEILEKRGNSDHTWSAVFKKSRGRHGWSWHTQRTSTFFEPKTLPFLPAYLSLDLGLLCCRQVYWSSNKNQMYRGNYFHLLFSFSFFLTAWLHHLWQHSFSNVKGSRQYQTRITTMAQLGQVSNLIQLSTLKKLLLLHTVVSYQSESASSKWELPLLPPSPLSYEESRQQKGSSHFNEKLSFWWDTTVFQQNFGFGQFLANFLARTMLHENDQGQNFQTLLMMRS